MDRQTKALLFDNMKPRYAFGFVHVDDCARVHVDALNEENVKSEEVPRWFIAAGRSEEGVGGEEVWKTVGDMVESEFKEDVENGVFRLGKDKVPINMPYRIDSRLTERVVLGGERMRGFPECVSEVARWYLGLPE